MKVRLFISTGIFFAGLISGICVQYFNSAANVGVYIAAALFIIYECLQCKERNKSRTHDILQQYVTEKNPKAKIYILFDSDQYQGQALGKSILRISVKWYKHILEYPEHMEYVKCTICHELYHINFGELGIRGVLENIVFKLCPVKKIKDKYLISVWLEEFKADYYGCQIYGDKKVFVEKMEFVKKNRTHENKKTRSDHPTWDMRIKYIEENIEPTLENVTQEYKAYYNLE